MRAGDAFDVPLRATPSSGYLWDVKGLPDGLVVLGSSVERLSEPEVPGGAVTQVFRLRAAHPGEYRLTFTLRRSWEEQSVETRTLKVIAE